MEIISFGNKRCVREAAEAGRLIATKERSATSSQKGSTFYTREALFWGPQGWILTVIPKKDFSRRHGYDACADARGRDAWGGERRHPAFKDLSSEEAWEWMQDASRVAGCRSLAEQTLEKKRQIMAEFDPAISAHASESIIAASRAEGVADGRADLDRRVKAKGYTSIRHRRARGWILYFYEGWEGEQKELFLIKAGAEDFEAVASAIAELSSNI